jgi:hypothetical protein
LPSSQDTQSFVRHWIVLTTSIRLMHLRL